MGEEMKETLESTMVDHVVPDCSSADAPMNMHGLEIIHPQFCAHVIEIFREALELQDGPRAMTKIPTLVRQKSFESDRFKRLQIQESDFSPCSSQTPSRSSSR